MPHEPHKCFADQFWQMKQFISIWQGSYKYFSELRLLEMQANIINTKNKREFSYVDQNIQIIVKSNY